MKKILCYFRQTHSQQLLMIFQVYILSLNQQLYSDEVHVGVQQFLTSGFKKIPNNFMETNYEFLTFYYLTFYYRP